MKNNLYISQEWELSLIQNIVEYTRTNFAINSNTCILQLSSEYSGILGQLLSHRLSVENRPIDIEPVNIPYSNEFTVVIHPDQLDPYENFIVVDSGCMSGNNFKTVKTILLNYGIYESNIFVTSICCDSRSCFKPTYCPLMYDGNTQIPHFWWECKTDKFNGK